MVLQICVLLVLPGSVVRKIVSIDKRRQWVSYGGFIAQCMQVPKVVVRLNQRTMSFAGFLSGVNHR